MPCPTCDHPMQAYIGIDICWCPRCGTQVRYDFASPTAQLKSISVVIVPKLVEQCRDFEEMLGKIDTGEAGAAEFWRGLGIHESIHTPEERPR